MLDEGVETATVRIGCRVPVGWTATRFRGGLATEGVRLSPYPHLTWLLQRLIVRPPQVFSLHEYKGVTHRLVVTEEGAAEFLWTTGPARVGYHVTAGSLGFFPCDDARHTLAITADSGYRGSALLLPNDQLESIAEAEGSGRRVEFGVIPVFQDPHLLACVLRVLAEGACRDLAGDVGTEIAARQVIIRLAARSGGCAPAWFKDRSVFGPPVMGRIVERVDASLARRASLDEISRDFGLSPSHFARKFQRSAGLSLNRFMNQRRIRRSLELLKTGMQPLAQVSLSLGFCSQSHFTRLFSSLTGVSPNQFRRSCRVGEE